MDYQGLAFIIAHVGYLSPSYKLPASLDLELVHSHEVGFYSDPSDCRITTGNRCSAQFFWLLKVSNLVVGKIVKDSQRGRFLNCELYFKTKL